MVREHPSNEWRTIGGVEIWFKHESLAVRADVNGEGDDQMGMMDTACPRCGCRDPKTIQHTESYFGSYGKGMPKFEDKIYLCHTCRIKFARRVPVME